MGRASKTKNQKKERAAALHNAQQEFATVPHSFVFHRGRVGKNVRQLILDVRKVMEPYTARALKVRKKNSLKDFVAVAGPLGVTHFLVFSKSPSSINFKLFRLPGGPTLTFKVTQYSLIKDVVSSLKRHRMHEQQFTHHPLLVLSNFGLQQIHIKLMASMFQNMFPSINVHKVNLNSIKRCLLISYDAETQLLDLRHYSVKVVPVGVSKGLKKLLQEKFPNMSRLEDISELLIKDINLSESEAEQDGTHNILELPQAYAGRGNMKAQQSAVRLTEIGPRMTLQLVKVEEGLAQGNVLYHSFIHKTEAEVQEILARKEAKLQLKAERRQKQEADVERKRQQREAHRKKSLAGIRRRQKQDGDSDAEDPGAPEQQDPADQSDESDAEYYRQEVGEEPDEDLFPKRTKRKRGASGSVLPRKRRRPSQPEQPATPHPTAPTRRAEHGKPRPRKGGPRQKDSQPHGGTGRPQGAPGRKPRRGPRRPGLEGGSKGPKFATSRLKGRGKLLTKGKTLFRRPGHAAKGKHEGRDGRCRGRRQASAGAQHALTGTGTDPAAQAGRGERGEQRGLQQVRVEGCQSTGLCPAARRGQAALPALGTAGGNSSSPLPLCGSARRPRHGISVRARGSCSPTASPLTAASLRASTSCSASAFGSRWFLSCAARSCTLPALPLPAHAAPPPRSLRPLPRGPHRGRQGLTPCPVPQPTPGMNASGSPCGNFSRFQEDLWPVLALQFPLALFGNAFAVYRFVVHERSWHSGIVYSFHLAVSGTLYSLSLPLLAVYYYPPKHWSYGPVLCKMERFLFNCNLYGSIFFVTCISLNRYLGIVYPLQVHRRLQLHHAKALSAAVWVLAGALSAPTLFFSELRGSAGNMECLGSASPERLPRFYPYSLLLAVLGCGLPFLLTASCYAAIVRTVFRNPHISRLEKRKVGLLVGAGVALYALSYLPYHVFRNVNLGRRLPRGGPENCSVSQAIHTAAQVCKILINLNICVHPLLYAALADSMQGCCSAGPANGERLEHVELRQRA
ncbi:P2Y purinoceptor 11 [Struthio camelus]|uniref:P2Y purinoceptor 11 n=1 Tax=Struthio camelus TaxID=8801 RepID=UPI0036040B2C